MLPYKEHHSFLSHVHENEEGGGGDEEVEGISWMVCQGGDDGGGGEMWVWLREQCLEGQCCTMKGSHGHAHMLANDDGTWVGTVTALPEVGGLSGWSQC